MQSISIVWFKRDLRLQDHAPLKAAIETGLSVLLLYCFEPKWMAAPDSSHRHWRFVWESIQDMNHSLQNQQINAAIHYGKAAVLDTLQMLQSDVQIQYLFSHEETGNALTYQRDKAISAFCSTQDITWKETPTGGVTRRLYHRKGWEKTFVERCETPLQNPDFQSFTPYIPSQRFFDYFKKNSIEESIRTPNPNFQPGGTSYAQRYLQSFLKKRHTQYFAHISKPAEARMSCSRIAPYLTWGCISVRQVWKALHQALEQGGNAYNLRQFRSRLFWQSHFIQKFETECRIEFENMNNGFDLIRSTVDTEKVAAWERGKTGIPLVDACMRCAEATGYLNFRMRSMLVSFLTHHLWQPWQAGAQHLARLWLDYEPGIHYCQFQMQAGTMGVNTIRIYNPSKQAQDHDPDAFFIKKWLPELEPLPPALAIEPWRMTALEQQLYRITLGETYPKPIVNLTESGQFAREKLWAHKKHPAVRKANHHILKVHTKRKKAEERTIMGDTKSVQDLKKNIKKQRK